MTGESEHLRSLIETLPVCVMRVALDGVMLAVNEAALGLLGTDTLAAVLNRPFPEHMLAEHADRWPDFAQRVWETGAASLECDLADTAGLQRTALLQGVALRDHPDGIESILLAIRDTSAARRLERHLQEEAARRPSLEAARAELEHARAERQRLAVLLDTSEAERRRLAEQVEQADEIRGALEAAHAADRLRLQQTLAEEQQLAVLLKERESRAQLVALQTQLAEAVALHERLRTLLAESEAQRTRMMERLDARLLQAERTFGQTILPGAEAEATGPGTNLTEDTR